MACLAGCIVPLIAFATIALVWGLPIALGIVALLALAGFLRRLFG